jgi:hypothetical protein
MTSLLERCHFDQSFHTHNNWISEYLANPPFFLLFNRILTSSHMGFRGPYTRVSEPLAHPTVWCLSSNSIGSCLHGVWFLASNKGFRAPRQSRGSNKGLVPFFQPGFPRRSEIQSYVVTLLPTRVSEPLGHPTVWRLSSNNRVVS